MIYAKVLDAWQGEMGRKKPECDCRRIVEPEMNAPTSNPLDDTPMTRRLRKLDVNPVITNPAAYFNVSASSYHVKRSSVAGCDSGAYLAHRHTAATFRAIATAFSPTNPDSVSNFIRRPKIAISTSKSTKMELKPIEELLRKPQTGSVPF